MKIIKQQNKNTINHSIPLQIQLNLFSEFIYKKFTIKMSVNLKKG